MQLQEDLLQFARMVEREVRVDTDVLRDARMEVSFDPLVCLVLVAGQLATQLHDKLREGWLFEELGGHALDQVLVHPLNILPVDNG